MISIFSSSNACLCWLFSISSLIGCATLDLHIKTPSATEMRHGWVALDCEISIQNFILFENAQAKANKLAPAHGVVGTCFCDCYSPIYRRTWGSVDGSHLSRNSPESYSRAKLSHGTFCPLSRFLVHKRLYHFLLYSTGFRYGMRAPQY